MSFIYGRPQCPDCGMAMITTEKSVDAQGAELRTIVCLRCEHIETSIEQIDRLGRPVSPSI